MRQSPAQWKGAIQNCFLPKYVSKKTGFAAKDHMLALGVTSACDFRDHGMSEAGEANVSTQERKLFLMWKI